MIIPCCKLTDTKIGAKVQIHAVTCIYNTIGVPVPELSIIMVITVAIIARISPTATCPGDIRLHTDNICPTGHGTHVEIAEVQINIMCGKNF